MALTETLDTNLLQSAKRLKGDAASNESPALRRKKKVLKALAYLVFFLVSLIFFTVVKIPDSAIANYMLNEANKSSTTHNFSADKVTVRFFPLPHIDIEKFAMDPRFPGAGIPLLFDQVKVYPNPLLGLGATFKADAYKSEITGAASRNAFRIESERIDLAKVPLIAALGFDLKGVLSGLSVQLAMQNQRIATADGEIRLKGTNLVYDPEALEILLRENLRMDVDLPVLSLGDLDVQGTASNGQVRIDRFKLGSPGKDLELQIASGTVQLSDATPLTRYDLHLLIKIGPALEKAVPSLAGMVGMLATKRPDGFYGMKIAGKLSDPVPSMKKE